MAVKLYEHQRNAVRQMHNGCILCGGVGSGKSIAALSYYYLQNGGASSWLEGLTEFIPMDDIDAKDLYIITTARKRDTLEWEKELGVFLMSTDKENQLYFSNVVVDSWNNIGKYKDAKNAFFIFDEQRVVGSGVWVKVFLKIAKTNDWILLSATPGDTWSDYIPVFLANNFFKNKTEFNREHVVFSRFSKFPKIDRYLKMGRLIRLRSRVLVDMEFDRHTTPHHEDVMVEYDQIIYKDITKRRWDPYKDEPIKNASALCYIWRKIVNSDESRQVAVLELFEKHPRAVIFYNFDYELEILKSLHYGDDVEVAEWNGHKHQAIPDSKRWIYLVQYTAGCEGWNCVRTDTIIFYSQNYSYKVMTQAAGRIDRLNTRFTDLYYYHLKSRAGIDLGIGRSLKSKKKFNETKYVNWRKEIQ